MKKTLCLLLVLGLFTNLYSQKKIKFYQTNWGNKLPWDQFCDRVKKSGYDGIEVWMPADEKNRIELKNAIKKHNLSIIFLHGTNKAMPFKESLKNYTIQLEKIMTWKPDLVNGHTGSDFYTDKQNKTFIDVANAISKKHRIPFYHETHRGRFSYSLPETNKHLKLSKELKLTLDISHWMVVHESLLQGKDSLLEEVENRTNHIHARVGHAEGPQVNDPEAPEWKSALNRHLDIWERVIKQKWASGKEVFTITTEFGPPDYLPTLPYTKIPVSDQWKANIFIMNTIKKRLKIE